MKKVDTNPAPLSKAEVKANLPVHEKSAASKRKEREADNRK